jgi:hypothetical protein
MSNPCLDRVLLQRDGLSQAGRDLPAIDPASTPVDGRKTPDWLRYLFELARHIRYVDEQGDAGDWQRFLEKDASVLLAHSIDERHASRLAKLKDLTEHTCAVRESADLWLLFDGLFAELIRLNHTAGLADDPRLAVSDALLHRIVPRLKPDLELLIGLYNSAVDALLPPWTDLPPSAEQVRTIGLAEVWWRTSEFTSWTDYWKGLQQPAVLATAVDRKEKVLAVAEYLRLILPSLANAVNDVATVAAQDFAKSLRGWPDHQPHMALLLSFLLLYDAAIAELDALTERHLAYYFDEVLQLGKLGPTPDRAYIVFELAKKVSSAVLKKGDRLSAGPDSNKEEILYALTEDVLVTTSSAAQFMAVCTTGQGNALVLRAAPVANSADGKGATLPPDQFWPPFGPASGPLARLGFAVSSPLLDLRGGERTLTFALAFTKNDIAVPLTNWDRRLQAELTGAKGWEKVKNISTVQDGGSLTITIKLDLKFPALASYSQAVHGGAFAAADPICRFTFVQDENEACNYGGLSPIAVRSCALTVEVSGIRSLEVETETGPVDPQKPFFPFGALPEKGVRCFLRCRELERKSVEQVTVNLAWKNMPADDLASYFSSYAAAARAKSSGGGAGATQTTANAASAALAPQSAVGVALGVQIPQNAAGFVSPSFAAAGGSTIPAALAADIVLLKNEYGALPGTGVGLEELRSGQGWLDDSIDIFGDEVTVSLSTPPQGTDTIGLQLVAPSFGFGFRVFPQLQAQTALEAGKAIKEGTALPTLPNPPFAPILSALSLDYHAGTDGKLTTGGSASDLQFFHIHPFGETRVTPAEVGVPLFPHDYASSDTVSNLGLLYLGLDSLRENERLSLLFSLEESTGSSASKDKTVLWSYVDENGAAIALTDKQIEDGTKGLIQSGIVRVNLPAAALRKNPLLPTRTAWLVACGTRDGKVGRVRSIRTQASTAELVAAERHPGLLTVPLPAGTINGLVAAPAAIKKVEQPVPSFGGRPAEDDAAFRRRISERLRHKHRALSIHDFETLALEAFPALYKVKCLNHTCGECGDAVVPGRVTIVVIPKVRATGASRALTPYAPEDLKAAVVDFLQSLTGPWVKVVSADPVFECVRLDFELGVSQGETWQLCRDRLNEEINALLCPWAYGDNSDIGFGGRVFRSRLIQFAESRPYVDYVANLTMSRCDTSGKALEEELEVMVGTSGRSIITSAGEHVIRSPGSQSTTQNPGAKG